MLKFGLHASPGSIAGSGLDGPGWADITGLVASIGCAIHCAAMPIIIGYLPAWGLGWVAEQGFHQVMAIVCSLMAIAAFVPGWRKHKKYLPAVLGLAGIALLTSHAFGSNDCCANAACSEPSCEWSADIELNATACHSVLQAGNTATSTTDVIARFWERFSWYVTPLGGCLLIVAHLANHRFGCRCCGGDDPCGVPNSSVN